MITTFSILGAVVLIWLIGKISLIYRFDREIKQLLSPSQNISDRIFHKYQLENLPEPVQRYFQRSLKEGQAYISNVRIKHDGLFKTGIDKGWIEIKGEQYATMERPGFVWRGTTSMFTARDMYIGDRGRLIVSLFGLYNVVNASGPQYDQGELLRWLAESVLYPTNLLPSERLKWFPIDTSTAKMTFDYNGLSLFFIITFDEIGQIIQMETKRYMDEKSLKIWIIKLANYKELNAVIIPTTFEVLWRLEKGDFSYAKFNMTEVEYDKHERF